MGDFNYPAIDFESNRVDSGEDSCAAKFLMMNFSVLGAKCHRDFKSKGRLSTLTLGLYYNISTYVIFTYPAQSSGIQFACFKPIMKTDQY